MCTFESRQFNGLLISAAQRGRLTQIGLPTQHRVENNGALYTSCEVIFQHYAQHCEFIWKSLFACWLSSVMHILWLKSNPWETPALSSQRGQRRPAFEGEGN